MPRATLTLKTYDPESGVTLKFKTDRAADVGRLINGLGRVGRHMAALPQKDESMTWLYVKLQLLVANCGSGQDVKMEDVPVAEQVAETAAKTSAPAASDAKAQSQPQQAGGGGGKKKKKNKK